MESLIEKFHESQYVENPANCVAFYLGMLCSIIRDQDRDKYIDRVIKEGLINFHELKDLKKLNVEVERWLFEDGGRSKLYRQKVAEYFVQVKPGDFTDGADQMLCFGIGSTVTNPLDNVLTFPEATKMWGLSDSTLREAASKKRIKEGEMRKSKGSNLITYAAMKRLYGEPKK